MNGLFSEKQAFIRLSEGIKKGIPIKNDEDSDLVAGHSKISNFELIRDSAKVVAFIESTIV